MRPAIAFSAAALLFSSLSSFTQNTLTSPSPENQVQVSVPRLVRLSGSLNNVDGQPRTVGVTLSIYRDEQGGTPLWQEVQNVTLDANGRYTLLLGSSKAEGLPLDLFSAGEARWLGMRVDQDQEQVRTPLVAVPYALKAADAETLGGKPSSSFVTAEQLSSNKVQTSLASGTTALAAVTGSGSQNIVPKFDSSGTNLINSRLFDDGTHIGFGTQSPTFQFDEQNTDASAAGSNMFRIQTPSVNGATMHFISTSANGRHFGFGSNFILGTGEFGIYDYTANANRFLIAGNGNIGIGTSTPQFNFDLQNSDSTAAGANIFRLRTPSVNGAVMHFQSTSANGHDYAFGSNFILGNGEFGIYDYTANANRVFITAAGNVGIGTSSPTAPLDVNGVIHTTGGLKFADGTVQNTASSTQSPTGPAQPFQASVGLNPANNGCDSQVLATVPANNRLAIELVTYVDATFGDYFYSVTTTAGGVKVEHFVHTFPEQGTQYVPIGGRLYADPGTQVTAKACLKNDTCTSPNLCIIVPPRSTVTLSGFLY